MAQYRLTIRRRFLRPPLVVLQVLAQVRTPAFPRSYVSDCWRDVTDQDLLDLTGTKILLTQLDEAAAQ